jgi:hypothetical protein
MSPDADQIQAELRCNQPYCVDDTVLGASSFHTANRPILVAAAVWYRRGSIFRDVNGQNVRTTGDANKWEHHT